MKNIINSVLKIVLVVTFFCTAAFADGDMSNGGKACTTGECPSGFAAPRTNSGDQSDTSVNMFAEAEIVVSNLVEKFLTEIGFI